MFDIDGDYTQSELKQKFFTKAGLGSLVGLGIGIGCIMNGVSAPTSCAISFGSAAGLGALGALFDLESGEGPTVTGSVAFLGSSTLVTAVTMAVSNVLQP